MNVGWALVILWISFDITVIGRNKKGELFNRS